MKVHCFLPTTACVFVQEDKYFASMYQTPDKLILLLDIQVSALVSKWGYSEPEEEINIEPKDWPRILNKEV